VTTAAVPTRLGRAFIQDPYPVYDRLRADGPAHEVVLWGGVPAWLVTRYDEAREMLSDPRLSKDATRAATLFPPDLVGVHGTSLQVHMLNTDPPDHTRLRRLVSKAFTARTVAHLRPRIEQIADDLLAGLDGPVDLVAEYALPLPIAVISAMLGVPEADWDNFRAWNVPFATSTSAEEIAAAHSLLVDYFGGLIARKRAHPADDLVSELIGVTDGAARLSESELVAMIFLLVFGGYETTVNLIGNSVHALLQEPAQLAALRADATLLPAAVEEFLRIESPVNVATVRFSTEPIDVGGVRIPAERLVLVGLPAANRDPAQFVDPDNLDLTRAANAHLSFGHGIHYCLGAPLARLEGQIALGRLLHHFGTITLDPAAELSYRPSILLRGLDSLPVVLRR
jgi:cytochrome P450